MALINDLWNYSLPGGFPWSWGGGATYTLADELHFSYDGFMHRTVQYSGGFYFKATLTEPISSNVSFAFKDGGLTDPNIFTPGLVYGETPGFARLTGIKFGSPTTQVIGGFNDQLIPSNSCQYEVFYKSTLRHLAIRIVSGGNVYTSGFFLSDNYAGLVPSFISALFFGSGEIVVSSLEGEDSQSDSQIDTIYNDTLLTGLGAPPPPAPSEPYVVYVSTTGNDFDALLNGGLDPLYPFLTLREALRFSKEYIVNNVNDVVVFFDDDGIYENFVIDFAEGSQKSLTITADLGKTIQVSGNEVSIIQGQNVKINNLIFDKGLTVLNGTRTSLFDCSFHDEGLKFLGSGSLVTIVASMFDDCSSGLRFDSAATYNNSILTDCILKNNIDAINIGSQNDVAIVNNTIVLNDRGLIYGETNELNVIGDIVNNIIAYNGIGLQTGNETTIIQTKIISNNIWGNVENYSVIQDQTGQNGNISEDPLFRDVFMGDLFLLDGSPCINSASTYFETSRDFLNENRNDRSFNDMGAMMKYEDDSSLPMKRRFFSLINSSLGSVIDLEIAKDKRPLLKQMFGNPGENRETNQYGKYLSSPGSILRAGSDTFISDIGNKRILKVNSSFNVTSRYKGNNSPDEEAGLNVPGLGFPYSLFSSAPNRLSSVGISDSRDSLSYVGFSLSPTIIVSSGSEPFSSFTDVVGSTPQTVAVEQDSPIIATVSGIVKGGLIRIDDNGTVVWSQVSISDTPPSPEEDISNFLITSHIKHSNGFYYLCDDRTLYKVSGPVNSLSVVSRLNLGRKRPLRIIGVLLNGNIAIYDGKKRTISAYTDDLVFVEDLMIHSGSGIEENCESIRQLIEYEIDVVSLTPTQIDIRDINERMEHWVTAPSMTSDRSSGRQSEITDSIIQYVASPDDQVYGMDLVSKSASFETPTLCDFGSSYHAEPFSSLNPVLFSYPAGILSGGYARWDGSGVTGAQFGDPILSTTSSNGDFDFQVKIIREMVSSNPHPLNSSYARMEETGNNFSIDLFWDDANIYNNGKGYYWRVKENGLVVWSEFALNQDDVTTSMVRIRKQGNFIHFIIQEDVNAPFGDPLSEYRLVLTRDYVSALAGLKLVCDGQHICKMDDLYISMSNMVGPALSGTSAGSTKKIIIESEDTYDAELSIQFWIKNSDLRNVSHRLFEIGSGFTNLKVDLIDSETIQWNMTQFSDLSDITVGGINGWHLLSFVRRRGFVSVFQNSNYIGQFEDDLTWGNGPIVLSEGSGCLMYDFRIQRKALDESAIRFYFDNITMSSGSSVLPITL